MQEICFTEIDSTNTYLKDHYQELENFTFVSSLSQTKGHGRSGRAWISENNNLLFSCLIKDQNLIKHYKKLSIISAYSLIEVLRTYGLSDLKIKWPNDLYYQDDKLAGILLEAISKQELECLIIGIGLNVNQVVFKGDYLRRPSSLKLILNRDIDLISLRKSIYEKLVDNFKRIEEIDFYKEIRELDYLRDKEAYILVNKEKRLIKVIGIDNDYSLLVKDDEVLKNMEAGEISFHL